MRTHIHSVTVLSLVLAASIATLSPDVRAEAGSSEPLYSDGPYAALLGRYLKSDADPLDNGFGATIAGGARRGSTALEVSASYTYAHSSKVLGGSLNGLLFPFDHLPGLFGLIGVGVENVDGYPQLGNTTFNVATVDGGFGYLFPLQLGAYHFGLRTQLLYEYGKRQARAQDQNPPQADLPVPSKLHDVVANIGFQFPLGRAPQPAAVPEPVAVVPPAAAADSDGDGVSDAIDQCPNTPAGSKVDDKGCPLPPPCKTPAPGERLSLAGCGAGDVVVLRGVNFEFNQSRLTPDAKTILDGVAGELKAYPDIKIELGGYTDAKGTETYNQRLSERRAAAVVAYLQGMGIAADRMRSAGYGETNPVADNDTDEGRELNRRVELKITDRSAAQAAVPPIENSAAPTTPPTPDASVTSAEPGNVSPQ